ncbi:recombination mediator RecR [candidate division CSSED10-310 bacterium]|uniref:Recombination protein RecR n=1 Tax=candidate division CSSED10-310 bacterium TaxID=2855610 RepID=A0ABV6Z4V7_UNCC1
MLGYPKSLGKLIDHLKRMPGIGQKTAQRLAFHILNLEPKGAQDLAQAILEARQKLIYCSVCFNLTEHDPCFICADPKRNQQTICVIEEPKDFITIEKIGEYQGVYHILGGSISPLEGRTPDDLKIKELVRRVTSSGIAEVILATNPNVEGEATALYIAKILKPLAVKVTRIARGIPVGGDLEFADEITMLRALEGRQEI